MLTNRGHSKGGRPQNSGQAEPSLSEYQQAKEKAGISDTQAKRWQSLASVDEGEFEERYDAMCTAIQACHSVDEVTDIRNKAMALEAYAKQAMNTDAERQACAIRLRAERHAGQLLSEQERDPISKGGSRSADQPEPPKSEYQQAKINANISNSQAKRWQLLAEVDPLVFENALEDPKKKPSTSGIIKKVNGSTGKMDPKALWLWCRVSSDDSPGIIPGQDVAQGRYLNTTGKPCTMSGTPCHNHTEPHTAHSAALV